MTATEAVIAGTPAPLLDTDNSAVDMRPTSQGAGAWHLDAACRGPHQGIFYPPARFERRADKRRREMRAKEICAECSVMSACREYAIQLGEAYGIWGGLTEAERRLAKAN